MKSVVRWDSVLEIGESDAIDERGSRKLRDLCEDIIEVNEREFVTVFKTGGPLESACYGNSKSPCGIKAAPCQPGTRSLDSHGVSPCWPCDKGEFQSATGASFCNTCPHGLGTEGRGAKAADACLEQCSPGQESASGLLPCTACPRGSFQPSQGASTCFRCPLGHGTLDVGASSAEDCLQICGDGILASTESCDDGNIISGDGCSAACKTEPNFECFSRRGPRMAQECSPASPRTNGVQGGRNETSSLVVCGDGHRDTVEGCDDGNQRSGDGCSARCAVEEGYSCRAPPAGPGGRSHRQHCAPVCGDGRRIAPEDCDDGNTAGGDGCSAACSVEPGWGCAGGSRGRDVCRRDTGPTGPVAGCVAGAGGGRVCLAAAACGVTRWGTNFSLAGEDLVVCLPEPLHHAVWGCVSARAGGAGACKRALDAVGGAFGVWQDAAQRAAQLRQLCLGVGADTARSCLVSVVRHLANLPHVPAGLGRVHPRRGSEEDAEGGGGGGWGGTVSEAAGESQARAAGIVEDGAAVAAAVAESNCAWRLGRYYAWDRELGCRCAAGTSAGPAGCRPAEADREGAAGAGAGTQQAGGGGNATEDGPEQWEELDRMCVKEAGPHTEHAAGEGCRCRAGYTADASEDGRSCRAGSHKLCRGAFGATVEFDGLRACRCKAGHVPINGTCVRGSDAVCRAGPLGPPPPSLLPRAALRDSRPSAGRWGRVSLGMAWAACSAPRRPHASPRLPTPPLASSRVPSPPFSSPPLPSPPLLPSPPFATFTSRPLDPKRYATRVPLAAPAAEQ